MSDRPIAVNSLVTLKSGGPNMTVVSISGGIAICEWGGTNRSAFSVQSLTPAVRGFTSSHRISSIEIAHICHEANRAYCLALGDTSQLPWSEAPTWQLNSAVKGVEFALSGDLRPEDSHNSWLEEKRRDGWRYGPVKDADLKEHPCFVPYAELPREQQIKDKIFLAICNVFKGA